MGIFFPPIPPVFTGGAQPYEQRHGAPPIFIPPDNPPFKQGGPIVAQAELVAIAQPNPWQYVFFGGWQPFTPKKLYPDLLNRPGEDPPFRYGGPYSTLAELLSINQPNPWQFKFLGARQPFEPGKVNPAISAVPVNNPPFNLGGPVANISAVVTITQPDPWQYKFLGNRQPFQPRQAAPATPGFTNDPPPIVFPGRLPTIAQIIAQQQPNPWVYDFNGAQQPYDFKRANPSQTTVPVNNPPFGERNAQIVSMITAMSQPELWQYKFFGRFQPYDGGGKLNPGISGASTGLYRGYIIF